MKTRENTPTYGAELTVHGLNLTRMCLLNEHDNIDNLFSQVDEEFGPKGILLMLRALSMTVMDIIDLQPRIGDLVKGVLDDPDKITNLFDAVDIETGEPVTFPAEDLPMLATGLRFMAECASADPQAAVLQFFTAYQSRDGMAELITGVLANLMAIMNTLPAEIRQQLVDYQPTVQDVLARQAERP